METSKSMVSSSLMFMFFILLLTVSVQAQRTPTATETPTTEFTFRGFTGNETEIEVEGAAAIKPDGLLRLNDRNPNVTGTAFYNKPVRLLETNSTNSTNSTIRSFSTSFVFVIIPSSSSNGGFGFTFTLSPTPNRPGAGSAQYLGLLNNQTNGLSTNHVFAVEFDTVQGFKDDADSIGNHIGLNFNSLDSEFQKSVVYYKDEDPDREEDFSLHSGKPIRASLDYDGETQIMNFTVYPASYKNKPIRPLISRSVPKLSGIVKEEMFVGFTAATGRDQSSAHYIMGWSFSSGGDNPIAEILNLSELPRAPPNTAKKEGYDFQVVALIVALSGVTVILLALLFFFAIYKKRLQQEEILEDWEIDHPHRFRYRDLYAATDGFKENRIIGTGGFGVVYRGNISPSSDEIAVKKITPNSMQGVREFVAEIESLGRLRHKNLVNLQGWCKHKNDLLLIYDYIPNGSLDSLLYSKPRRSGAVLSWNARFQIAKGIAAGLLYLHEEWEKIVIHRDVKPSNVLIDSDLNPRLGDFGLARLYERGTQTQTTVIVGTIGYMAPELTRSRKSSTKSDVFAFGVLLLEIVSGRRPTDSGSFFLADWVMELRGNGEDKILEAVDPRLGSGYDGGEAKLALTVGLLCCHQRPASRPSMRMVIRYLNRDEDLPEIDDNWGFSDYSSSSRSEFGSKFEYVSSDRASSSIGAFSVTRISTSSNISGR